MERESTKLNDLVNENLTYLKDYAENTDSKMIKCKP